MRARKIRTMIAAATTSILASAGLAFPLTVAHAVAAGDVPICANNIITDKQANVKVTASGQETEGEKGPEKAADGNIGPDDKATPAIHNAEGASRWSADNSDTVWIQVDFGGTASLEKVQLYWGNTFGNPYKLQAQDAQGTWRDLALNADGDTQASGKKAGATEHSFSTPETMRALKMQISGKSQNGTDSSQWPLSLWEISACGTLTSDSEPQPELTPEPEAVKTASYESIIPAPLKAVPAQGDDVFLPTEKLAIKASGDAEAPAEYLARRLRQVTGWNIPVAANAGAGTDLAGTGAGDVADADTTSSEGAAPGGQTAAPLIEYIIVPHLTVQGVNDAQKDEAYTLAVSANKVTITARTATGALWGTQTLVQLLGPWAHFGEQTANALYQIPAGTIEDGPRFSYRGVMVDPARSFIPKDELLDLMQLMSAYKMNALHLHLTDDPGWRIEIPNEGKAADDPIDYSLFTERAGKTAFKQGESALADGQPGRTGYYTLADYEEIVDTANSLGITIVPEVDGPGHMEAALYSIPELNSEYSYPHPCKELKSTSAADIAEYKQIDPTCQESTAPVPSYKNNIHTSLDPTNENTYKFTAHVLKLLADKSNSPYLHIGGDEAAVTDHEHYKTYMDTVLKQVNSLGKIPIIWNEGLAALNADTDQLTNAVVQYWTGEPNNIPWRIKNFIDKGGKFIVSRAAAYYYPQHEDTSIPGAVWACDADACNLKDAYNDEPQDYLRVDNGDLTLDIADSSILGVEGAMWSEHLRTDHDLQFSVFPRMLAHAETGWTAQDGKDWSRFREAIAGQGNALNTANATFFTSPFVDWEISGAWAAGADSTVTAGQGDKGDSSAESNTAERLIAYVSAPAASAESTDATALKATLTLTPKASESGDGDAQADSQGGSEGSGESTPTETITLPVRLELDTPYHFTDENQTTGRQMNSIFRLYADYSDLPVGEYAMRLDLVSENLASDTLVSTLSVVDSGALPPSGGENPDSSNGKDPDNTDDTADKADDTTENTDDSQQPGKDQSSGKDNGGSDHGAIINGGTGTTAEKSGNVETLENTGSQTGSFAALAIILLGAGGIVLRLRKRKAM